MATPSGLARRLGTADAVVIGLGSMIGAGMFAVFAPAAHAAGRWLLAALALAAIVVYCNATSSARLAPATRRPAAPTCTAGNASVCSGDTLPVGPSWSARPLPAPRWR